MTGRMAFLKNALKDDKHSQVLVDNIMCGNENITYPEFLQLFGHDPLPTAVIGVEKKRPMTSSRTRQSVTASDSYKNYMFAQVPNCTRFEPSKGSVAVNPMVRRLSFLCPRCSCLFLISHTSCLAGSRNARWNAVD